QHDRVRQVRTADYSAAVGDRLQHGDLPGYHAAPGDAGRRGRVARDRLGRNTIRTSRPDAASEPALRAPALQRLQPVRLGYLQLLAARGDTMTATANDTVKPNIHKGLSGVVVDTTAVSKVVPETNSLTYRGYAVQDLAAHCGFEQVAYLLWHGELPTDAELALFCQRERAARRVDRSLLALVAKHPDNCHPMDVVRTAISYLGAEDPAEDDSAESANVAKALRMFAVLPTIVAVDMRRRRGLPPVAPHSQLGYAENFLRMCFG